MIIKTSSGCSNYHVLNRYSKQAMRQLPGRHRHMKFHVKLIGRTNILACASLINPFFYRLLIFFRYWSIFFLTIFSLKIHIFKKKSADIDPIFLGLFAKPGTLYFFALTMKSEDIFQFFFRW